MNDPALYRDNNSTQRKDVQEILDGFHFKWKDNAKIMDVGCGDGGITLTILKKYIPEKFSVLVGSDISDESVKFAQNHHGNEKIRFIRLDIQEDLSKELKNNFDHLFSFYTFHWVQKQEAAFSNIYEMLTNGGNCLLIFLGSTSVYEIYDELSRTQKWNADLKNIETKFFSPYFKSQDPESEIRNMMQRIGFKNIVVKAALKSFPYAGGEQEFRMLMKSLNPFDGLNEKWDEFMDDYVKLDADAGTCKHKLLIVYGEK